MKKTILTLLIIIGLLGIIFYLSTQRKTLITDKVSKYEGADLITVETPSSGQIISNPIIIKGKARGNWYFEGSFPARLIDANGKVLGTVPVQAIGNWMTTEFVSFATTMNYATSSTKIGTLILKKDNPSGLLENDNELRIPIIFATFDSDSKEKTSVKVFFNNSTKGAECEKVTPALREVSKVAAIGKTTIEELLKGPTAMEKSQGFSTAINANVKVNSLTVSNGTARIDFDSNFNKNLSGSCLVLAVRAQVEETLKQFPTIQDVIISVNGETESILEP